MPEALDLSFDHNPGHCCYRCLSFSFFSFFFAAFVYLGNLCQNEMNILAVVGILMLYTYATTAIAVPSPLSYENPDSNVTLTLASSSSTANDLPPDPQTITIPSVGLVRCYSYQQSLWENDILRVLMHAANIIRIFFNAGQGGQPIGYPQRYAMGHANFSFDPSPGLTWRQWSYVLLFLISNAQEYTPAMFLLLVSDGPTGVWNGSLITI